MKGSNLLVLAAVLGGGYLIMKKQSSGGGGSLQSVFDNLSSMLGSLGNSLGIGSGSGSGSVNTINTNTTPGTNKSGGGGNSSDVIFGGTPGGVLDKNAVPAVTVLPTSAYVPNTVYQNTIFSNIPAPTTMPVVKSTVIENPYANPTDIANYLNHLGIKY